MIDEKKIKSAAQGYCDATYGTLNTNPFIAEGFRKGAKWAINELSKDLVHPASENAKIALLKEIAIYYSGQTINSIIQQLEAIRKELIGQYKKY